MLKVIRKNLNQILLFILIGVLSAVIEIISFKIFSLPQIYPSFIPFEIKYAYPFSNFSSSACGILFNYILSITFVFKRGKHSKRKEFIYFLFISFFSMLMTWIIYAILLNFIQQDFCFYFCLSVEIFCKIIAIGLVSILNYIVKKKFIFNE